MKKMSDYDLSECIASGQWQCTVEEVQAAAERLLEEKKTILGLLLVKVDELIDLSDTHGECRTDLSLEKLVAKRKEFETWLQSVSS
jgi:hypothetical protein